MLAQKIFMIVLKSNKSFSINSYFGRPFKLVQLSLMLTFSVLFSLSPYPFIPHLQNWVVRTNMEQLCDSLYVYEEMKSVAHA